MTRKEMLRKLEEALGRELSIDSKVEPLDKNGDDERVVMCMRTEHGPAALPTAVPKGCATCGADVWVSPSTIEMVEQYNATVKCVECVARDDVHREDFCMSPVTPTQQMELNKYFEDQDNDDFRNAFFRTMRHAPGSRRD